MSKRHNSTRLPKACASPPRTLFTTAVDVESVDISQVDVGRLVVYHVLRVCWAQARGQQARSLQRAVPWPCDQVTCRVAVRVKQLAGLVGCTCAIDGDHPRKRLPGRSVPRGSGRLPGPQARVASREGRHSARLRLRVQPSARGVVQHHLRVSGTGSLSTSRSWCRQFLP
jgi:hypothetical protein